MLSRALKSGGDAGSDAGSDAGGDGGGGAAGNGVYDASCAGMRLAKGGGFGPEMPAAWGGGGRSSAVSSTSSSPRGSTSSSPRGSIGEGSGGRSGGTGSGGQTSTPTRPTLAGMCGKVQTSNCVNQMQSQPRLRWFLSLVPTICMLVTRSTKLILYFFCHIYLLKISTD